MGNLSTKHGWDLVVDDGEEISNEEALNEETLNEETVVEDSGNVNNVSYLVEGISNKFSDQDSASSPL